MLLCKSQFLCVRICSENYFCEIVYFEPQKILYVNFCFIFVILNYGWGNKAEEKNKDLTCTSLILLVK